MGSSNFYFELLGAISSGISLLPFIVALFHKELFRSTLYPIVTLSSLAVFTEILNVIHGLLKLNNYYLFHIYTLVEFSLVSLFYINFFKDYFKPHIIYFILFCFPIVAFIDYRINGLDFVDNISSSVACIILTSYSLFLFYFMLKHLIVDSLLAYPIFWFNSAILIYFSGNLFLFAFSVILEDIDPAKNGMLWLTIHTFFNISFNVLITIGIWKTRVK